MVQLQSRRSFLKMGGVASSTVALAGCSQFSSEEDGIELGHILIENAHSNPHTIRIELERDGDVILQETVEVMANSGEMIEATWSIDPAVYDLYYVVIGPDETPDIRTKRLTADDKDAENQSCNLVRIMIGVPAQMPPSTSVTTPSANEPTCSD